MGVSTKKWGPHAWIFLHAIALLIRRKRDGLMLFRTLRDILPCVHCRKSFSSFLPQLLVSASRRTGPKTRSAVDWPLFVYLAHTRVNMKLYGQDVEAGRPLRKWVAYAPPMEEVPVRAEREWTEHMCAFLLYALHDYDAKRAKAFVRFLDALSRILVRAEVSFASAWFETWQKHRAAFASTYDHACRVRAVRELQSHTPAKVTCTYNEACTRCEAGVVQCKIPNFVRAQD